MPNALTVGVDKSGFVPAWFALSWFAVPSEVAPNELSEKQLELLNAVSN